MGWKIQGEMENCPKMVIIVAPHTSNWDFIVGMGAKVALGLNGKWLGKHTIFFWPLGILLRWLGGIPIDRASSHGTVEQVIEVFQKNEQMVLGLSPEGTRTRIEKWKMGFYHIALGAGVPIIPVSLDYGRKILRIGNKIVPTGNEPQDFKLIHDYFAPAKAKHPDQFSNINHRDTESQS